MDIISEMIGSMPFVDILPINYSQPFTTTYTIGETRMKTIKIKTADLVTSLKTNRAKHEAEYKLAVIEYRKACKKQLENYLAKIKPEEAKIDLKNPVKTLYLTIQAPSCFLTEYDRASMMMGMTVDSIIELDENDFRRYVMDEWDWKSGFNASNSLYKSFSGSKIQSFDSGLSVHSNEFILPTSLEDDPDAIG